ncbi:TetR/AcrR family transcriptional regulator [Nocardioides bruguierae]|uniref:TetR/AcrR family transcriptional regulator n=1 Tax=Nocardioides bruguierae TaxID=2945102 RepID=UPI002021CE8A|nr:TetR/AcrR family transcriptional regulator [Nocardioides bruguierae]MCL8025664.1 TetR/AcrR family transcriptional regulator [Nocardioides bruguierae]
MQTPPSARPGRGRPRDAALDEKVLEATRTLVRDLGYHAVTMDRIAAAAGVGKASLYRRWPHRAAVITAAFTPELTTVPAIDTGDVDGDLLAHLHDTLGMLLLLGDPSVVASAIAEWGDEGQRHLGDLLRRRSEHGIEVVQRWREAGALGDGWRADLLMDSWSGYLLLRVLLDRCVPTEEELVSLVQQVPRG